MRDLHSFPTRRSSDLLSGLVLEKIRVNTREALHLADAALLIARRLRRKKGLAEGLRTKANALYACGQNRAAVEHQDRKSTRLNSSHITISYAVFCLKK